MRRFLKFLKLTVAGRTWLSRCWMGFHSWNYPGGHCEKCDKCDEFFGRHDACRAAGRRVFK